MLTLRPAPSQESKCHPDRLTFKMCVDLSHVSVLWENQVFTSLYRGKVKNVCLYLIFCSSLPSPIGVIGVSMVTTAGRQSTCSRRWSPPIRRPSSLTWRALTASCLYHSLTVPRRLPRRVSSKNRGVLLVSPPSVLTLSYIVVHSLFSLFIFVHLYSPALLGSEIQSPSIPLSVICSSLLSYPPPSIILYSYILEAFAHLFAVIDWRKPLRLIQYDCKNIGNYYQMGSRWVSALTHSHTHAHSRINSHHVD